MTYVLSIVIFLLCIAWHYDNKHKKILIERVKQIENKNKSLNIVYEDYAQHQKAYAQIILYLNSMINGKGDLKLHGKDKLIVITTLKEVLKKVYKAYNR